MGGTVLEVKRHLDGRRQVFSCEPLLLTPQRAVVRFVNPEAVGLFLPAGCITTAFFWRRRNYNLYRFRDPDGALIGHRLDVIDQVRIGRERIEYLDLLLDLWVDAQSRVRVEDEDEVAAFAGRGVLSSDQLRIIEKTRRYLLASHHKIIERVIDTFVKT